MKMVKSLLLGSAAGLLAVAGAQAADLPVKAKPVEYVKICSLYGAGFYYLPGTDICVKIGGYVRAQYFYGSGTGATNGPFYQGAGGAQNTRMFGNTNDFVFRTRTIVTMDTRAPTDWGVVRTYMNVGWTHDGPGAASGGTAAGLYVNRAFIQWAGFTFGKAQSFYDHLPMASFTYYGVPFSDTGDGGQMLAAYTAQWGNGISTTVSLEDPRIQGIHNVDTLGLACTNILLGPNTNPACTAFNPAAPALPINVVDFANVATNLVTPFQVGTLYNNSNGNIKIPDVVSNFRIDQAWGSFQVMSAAHQVSQSYDYAPCAIGGTTLTGALPCGHQNDKWGWAAGVGATINLPFIAAGDRFSFQVNWSEGAFRYVNIVQSGSASPAYFGGANSLGFGFATDAIVRDNVPGVQAGSLELTKAWGAMAAFEHLWTPALRTSWYGGYLAVDYNGNATGYICNAIVRNHPASPAFTNAVGNTVNNPTNCDPDWGQVYVGTRTQWNIRPDFYMGVDLLYQKLETAFAGQINYFRLSSNPRPSGVYTVEDQEALSLTFRVHRDILP